MRIWMWNNRRKKEKRRNAHWWRGGKWVGSESKSLVCIWPFQAKKKMFLFVFHAVTFLWCHDCVSSSQVVCVQMFSGSPCLFDVCILFFRKGHFSVFLYEYASWVWKACELLRKTAKKKEGFSQRKKKPEQLKKSRKKNTWWHRPDPAALRLQQTENLLFFFLVVRHVNSFRFCKNKMCESSKMERREVKQEKRKQNICEGPEFKFFVFTEGSFTKEKTWNKADNRKKCVGFSESGVFFLT